MTPIDDFDRAAAAVTRIINAVRPGQLGRQSTDIEPDLAEQALTGRRQRFGSMPRAPGGPFGPECRASDGVSAADRLAAFLGRESVSSTKGSRGE